MVAHKNTKLKVRKALLETLDRAIARISSTSADPAGPLRERISVRVRTRAGPAFTLRK